MGCGYVTQKVKRALVQNTANADERIKLAATLAQLNSPIDKYITICSHFHCSALPFSLLISISANGRPAVIWFVISIHGIERIQE